MKCEIKHRWNSTLLFTCEAASLGLAVAAAVKSGADLYGTFSRIGSVGPDTGVKLDRYGRIVETK